MSYSSLVLATKFHDDMFYDNRYYAKVGGLGIEEINKLELEALFLIDFDLVIDATLFDTYYCELERPTRVATARSSPTLRLRTSSLEDAPRSQLRG